MPHFNRGGRVVAGVAGTKISVDGTWIGERGLAVWLDDDRVLFNDATSGVLSTYDIRSGTVTRNLADGHGANELVADDGQWAAWLGGYGLYTSRGLVFPIGGLGTLRRDQLVWTNNRQAGAPWFVSTPDGSGVQLLTSDPIRAVTIDSADGAIGYVVRRRMYVDGVLWPTRSDAGVFMPRLVTTGQGVRWLLYQTHGEYVLLQQRGGRGIVVGQGRPARGFFGPDIRAIGPTSVEIVWSTGAAEQPSVIRRRTIDLGAVTDIDLLMGDLGEEPPESDEGDSGDDQAPPPVLPEPPPYAGQPIVTIGAYGGELDPRSTWRVVVDDLAHPDQHVVVSLKPHRPPNVMSVHARWETAHGETETTILRPVAIVMVPSPLPPPVPPEPLPPPPPPSGSLRSVRANGLVFSTDREPIWRWRGVTAFTAYREWLAGGGWSERLDAFVDYLRTRSALTEWVWRVFGMWDRRGQPDEAWAHFDPRVHGDGYYDRLSDFADWLADRQCRLEFVALTDCGPDKFGLDVEWQRTHVRRVAAALAPRPNAFLELGNEPWKNGVDPHAFGLDDVTAAFRMPVARGAQQDGESLYQPFTSVGYHTDHPPRDAEWPRKAKNILEHTRLGGYPGAPLLVPGVINEPMRIGGPGGSLDARDFADFFAVADLVSAGATIHAESFKCCQQPTEDEDRIVRAIVTVWRTGRIPATAASLGRYTRGGLSDCPLVHDDAQALRTYAMIEDDEWATAVVVRPAASYIPVAAEGWAILSLSGPHSQIVHLTRVR